MGKIDVKSCGDCGELERLVKMETTQADHTTKIDNIDVKLDVVVEVVAFIKGQIQGQVASNSFIGGIAAAGGLFGIGIYKLIAPVAKPILSLIFPSLGAILK